MCKCHKRCIYSRIAWWLVVIGGLNWGLVGIGMLVHSNWNVVNMIFGSWPAVEAIVYVLVGVATAMKVFNCRCKVCKSAEANCPGCSVKNPSMPSGNPM